MVLRLIYTLFLGIFLAIFIGVGIAAFYPAPKRPEMPAVLKYCSQDVAQGSAKLAEYEKQATAFDTAEKAYFAANQTYNRNVSIITIASAIIIVIASLTLFKTIALLADGLLLGGVLTLIYSVIRGFGTEDNMFRFIVVAIGFAVSLFLGYMKFIRPREKGVSA